mgnify:CR=1 FL=1
MQISRQIFDLVEGEAITTTKTPLESIRPQWPDLLSAFSQEQLCAKVHARASLVVDDVNWISLLVLYGT